MRRKKSSLLNLGFHYKRSVSGLFSSLCLLLFGLGFLFSIPFLFLSACGKKPNGNIQGREIRISYDKDNFPFSKENKDKEAEGFEVELMQKVSEKEGFHLKFLAKNHSALLPSLVTGTSDMAIGGLVREEEEKRLQFSESYGTVDLGLLLLQKGKADEGEGIDLSKEGEITESLFGKTVILKEGSYAADFLEKKREENEFFLKVVQSKEDLLLGIEEGEADAAADLCPVLKDLEETEEKKSGKSEFTLLVLEKGKSLSFAVSRGQNGEILRAFNRGLRKLKESGEYEELLKKYEIHS